MMSSDLLDHVRWAEPPPYIVSVDAPDPRLDSITELAVKSTGADIGGISLIFQSQIWMPSRYGVEARYLPRAGSFCTWAVEGTDRFEVPDASTDARFSPNPLVSGALRLRHYAAMPLRGAGPHLTGTLWVMSREPRTLSPAQFAQLRLMADIAADMLSARYCDSTTGMYNRNVFLHHLQCVLDHTTEGPTILVGYLNLVGFRRMNDVHGRSGGDRVLRQFGARMLDWAAPRGLLGHLGGDRFAFALTGPDDALRERVALLGAAIDAPFVDDCGAVQQLRARIGTWQHPLPCTGAADDVLDAAETAAAAIDTVREHSIVRAYDSALRTGSRLRYELGDVLRGADRYGELEVHYQPQVDIGTGGLLGMEALVRWRHPDFGLVEPQSFIGQAEASGDIVELDMRVMDIVCRDLRGWRERDLAAVPVALNLSRDSLLHPRMLERLEAALVANGVPAHLLEFEITESLMLESPGLLQERVAALRLLGVRIAVDDFGTGYSNLDALANLRFDRLKADRRFVDGVAANPRTAGLLLLIKGIADLSGAELLCEGLERRDDLDWLVGHGAQRVQGWYFSAARPGAAVEAWLTRFAHAAAPLPVEDMRALLA